MFKKRWTVYSEEENTWQKFKKFHHINQPATLFIVIRLINYQVYKLTIFDFFIKLLFIKNKICVIMKNNYNDFVIFVTKNKNDDFGKKTQKLKIFFFQKKRQKNFKKNFLKIMKKNVPLKNYNFSLHISSCNFCFIFKSERA